MKKEMPDLEVLKYHGTDEKPDIKIFVSHRIDMDSQIIDNPLYIPVRCGAVFDDRENIDMLGDDTGDNISNKRLHYSELTVQYWAWKNCEAEYYGLCHYRRYLAYKNVENGNYRNDANQVVESVLSPFSAKKYGINDYYRMRNEIIKYDVIVNESFDVTKKETPHGFCTNVYEYWKAHENHLFEKGTIDRLGIIIKKNFPKYYKYYKKYMNGKDGRGYNCFVMRKEYFFELCEFQFSVLAEIEKRIDDELYGENFSRTCAYLSEILYGIYVCYLKSKAVIFSEKPLVFFEKTNNLDEVVPIFEKNSIPIVVMSSSYYLPYLAVYIQSLSETCSINNNYDIIVLHSDIKKEDINCIKKIEKNNISVRFIDAQLLIDNTHFFVSSSSYSKEAYYRLFTPWILPKYDKIIISDLDIIFGHDIAELYNIDMEEKWAIGVRDILWQGMIPTDFAGIVSYIENEYPISNPYNYINTGMMVLNLDAMRNNYDMERVLDIAQNRNYRYQEQCIMNLLLEEHIKYVDLKWNYYVPVNDDVRFLIKQSPSKIRDEYDNCIDDIYVYHFAARPKPWENPSGLWFEKWWDNARKTVYYESILYRMCNELYEKMHATECGQLNNRDSLFTRARRFKKQFGLAMSVKHFFDKVKYQLRT